MPAHLTRFLDEIDQRRGFVRSEPEPRYYTRESVAERLPHAWRPSVFPKFEQDGRVLWSIYDGYPQDTVGCVWIGADGRFCRAHSCNDEVLAALNAAFEEDA